MTPGGTPRRRHAEPIGIGLAKWNDIVISVALVLALVAACLSTPAAQRAVRTFDAAAFLGAINEVGLGMATENMPLAQDTD